MLKKESGEGKGVDAWGGPVFDPSANVLLLVEAANKRQDDLRDFTIKFLDSKLDHIETMAILRAEHAKEIRESEANRVNAIRQVDVLAVNTAADRASAAIQALAATTTANAETLRSMVANTAASIAAQTSATVQGITDRIAALEQSSYQERGKQLVADPALTALMEEVKKLGAVVSNTAGSSAGRNQMWGYIVGGIGLLFVVYRAMTGH